jgi:hypothetical protein
VPILVVPRQRLAVAVGQVVSTLSPYLFAEITSNVTERGDGVLSPHRICSLLLESKGYF